ncbi:MAG: DUF1501 domain-containing protein [Verrucomicrobia bacterium]|nr:DUF1501 domain-containing protein [Verrucomicrobiota bacterium]
MNAPFLTRRHALQSLACGFGSLAFAGMTAQRAQAAANPLAPRQPHHTPRAKSVIFLFMQGGVSHVDSFDHKPLLDERDGQLMGFNDARKIANSGKREESNQRVMKSLWKHARHGQTGHWGSELFPEMCQHMDDLTFIHSMHTEGIAHGPATLFLHCGATQFIRPSMGSWISYGLGAENENLPAFVSLSPSAGNGGPRNYGNAFLPPVFQGTGIGKAGTPIMEATIRNLTNPKLSLGEQRRHFDFLQELNAEQLKKSPGDAELEAVIASYELAWRMQNNAPDTLDLNKETEATKKLYGIGDSKTDNFGRQCLMARRLVESGVRYIQVTYGDNTANPAWDQHSNMPKHKDHALAVDKPIAGLLQDLKARGLLDDTIVWWGGEFGRTPYAEKNGTGRDHNAGGFTVWLAGGGFKPGFSFGATDEFGHLAVENKVHMHDLHATILHQLGLDHEKLTYRFDGRDYRLTDVHGHVVKEVLV